MNDNYDEEIELTPEEIAEERMAAAEARECDSRVCRGGPDTHLSSEQKGS